METNMNVDDEKKNRETVTFRLLLHHSSSFISAAAAVQLLHAATINPRYRYAYARQLSEHKPRWRCINVHCAQQVTC